MPSSGPDYASLEMEQQESNSMEDHSMECVFKVGDVVRLSGDAGEVERSFNETAYCWDDLMVPMCGQTFKVLEVDSSLVVGLESPDGTQNNVWYFPVSVLTLLHRKDEEAIIMQYAVFIGKALAGAIRTTFEDAGQLFCQAVFLIKEWHNLSSHMIIYTLSSISAGLALAILGPTKEYMSMRRMRAKALAKRSSLVDSLGIDADNSAMAISTISTENTLRHVREPDAGTYTLRDTSIVELITGKGYMKKHSEQAHRVLVGASTFSWCSMVILYLVDTPACGEQTSRWKWMCFLVSCIVDFVAQLWVSLHGRQGYHLLIFKPRRFLFGTFLSVVGKFDTFGDVTFTSMLSNCEPITWFSIKGSVYKAPFGLSLQDVSQFTLIVGVFIFQAGPGMLFLLRKQWLPMTFKMNEFNLLLTVMEFEADEQD